MYKRQDLGCHTFSFSSHKIYGPKGMGALYKRKDVKINSLVIGGGQEKGLRSGKMCIRDRGEDKMD